MVSKLSEVTELHSYGRGEERSGSPRRTHPLRPWIWAVAASANWWVEWTTFMGAGGVSPVFAFAFLGPRVTAALEMLCWKLEAARGRRIVFVDNCRS